PDDDINKKLISLIDQEQSYIRIAVFNFTNRTIAQALIDAAKRGVKVEVITDITCIFDRYNKIDQLYDNDIAVLIFDAKKNKTRGIMHHKFALFSNNKGGTTYVWTGSCNFTRSGCQINQENGLLLADQTIINKFLQQFERIKKQTYGYKPFIQK
ncbi:MAG: phospholipase D-like domain-containing protein, partial [Candidatus Babeliales bacterium]